MECFRSVADRFGVSIRTCWNAVHIICKNILQTNKEYQFIAWPNEVRAEQIADYYKRKTGFPGIRCIDGTHISIPAPKEHPNSYINRKNFHSVLLQVVCDEKMMFTDCYTGEVGSIHDSCSLKIPYEQHMLGDQGYGLKTYLMIPYKDNGHPSERQKLFNHTLSSNRVVVEKAIGLLKNRFRRLYGLQTQKSDLIPLFIMSACILHNICLQQKDFLEYSFEPEKDISRSISHQQQDSQAQRKMDEIALQLNMTETNLKKIVF